MTKGVVTDMQAKRTPSLVGKMEIMRNKDDAQNNDLRIKDMHFGMFSNYKYTGFIYSRLDGTNLFMEKYFENGIAVSSDDSLNIRSHVKDKDKYDLILSFQNRHVSSSDDDYYARFIEEFPLNETVSYINNKSDTSRLYMTSTPDRIVVDAIEEKVLGFYSFYMNIGMNRIKMFSNINHKEESLLVDSILPYWTEGKADSIKTIYIQYFNSNQLQIEDRTISVDIESYIERLHKKHFMEDYFTDEGDGVPDYDLYISESESGQLCEAYEWMSIPDLELAFKEYLKLK